MGEIDDLRSQLADNDAQTLGLRTQRLAELGNPDYGGVYTPIYEYLQELDRLYIDGHFMAVIVFSGTIIEHILRSKLFDIVPQQVIETASLGKLGTMAKRKKLITKMSFNRLCIVKEMRNTLVHMDNSSDFATEMMSAACPDIDDPVIQQIWFFNGSQLGLMAKTCADIAKEFVAENISRQD
jgi:hypothetical protein